MVSLWVSLCIVLGKFPTWDTKSSKVNIFQVARAIKRPPWGSQYDVRKRVENDETIKILACLTFVCNLLRLQLYKNPCNQTSSHFFGWHFWNCSPLHVAQTSFRQYVTKFFGNARDLYGDSPSFFWGEKKHPVGNLRIWVPKQTTPTRRSV